MKAQDAVFGLISSLGLLGCSGASPELAHPLSPSERIRLLIRQLSDGTKRERIKAEEELFHIGEPTVQLLQTAITKAQDVEAQERETRLRSVLAVVRSARYFPMEVGHRWVYKSGRSEVTFEVRGTSQVRGWKCFEVVRTIGSEQSVFYLSVSRKGVKIHKVDGDYFSPPFLEFEFPLIGKPNNWEWTGSIGEQFWTIKSESKPRSLVRVPMGMYLAIYVREAMIRGRNREAGSTNYWLAEGIGVVKLTGKRGDLHNPTGKEFIWELKEFKKRSD